MTSPPMKFENGLETQPPLPALSSTADTYVVNSDTYNTDLKLVSQTRADRGGIAGLCRASSIKVIELRLKVVLNYANVQCAFIWTSLFFPNQRSEECETV